MDDPIFGPWGGESVQSPPGASESRAPLPPPAPSTTPRWRAPAGPPPTVPPPEKQPKPLPAQAGRPQPSSVAPVPRARLSGTAGFLRSMAVPRLQEVVRRLQMARHTAAVEDFLDGRPPSLTLSLQPWRGPWTHELSPAAGRLDLTLEDGPAGPVTIRTWLDASADEATLETRVPAAKLSAAWLEAHALDFVERLLARA